ncbi:zonadhesin-like isoform X4 [Bradysia coprophila]|uniref:zonadhesin-like isoform X4 n=1 Tax=Bradysia coprophila TaxID=38358 RepID=UPI00187D9E2B|nr:zonadhesin-like isoform X4 [Bradysia coprophila]
MKAFKIVVITLIFCQKAIAGDSQPSRGCLKSNEEYTTCGTACPLTCDNYNNPPTFCTKQCIIGCVCKPGYVRNKSGNCVLPCDCKPEVLRCTKKFEVYNSCGSACPPTCDNYKNPPACTKQCVPGCYCQEGYVRNDAGNCVLPCDCEPEVPRCTKKFEVFNPCGSACPLTCDNYKHPPVCTRQCVPECYCKEGYVRNDAGNCVLPCDCEPEVPRCTKKFEVFNPCGSACPLTCDNYKNPPVCTKKCVPGCYCKEGYVRNDAGNCVLPCDCEPEVPRCTKKFEVFNPCGSACPLTCDNYKNPPVCTKKCVPGCYCKEGYVRNGAGNCVLSCDCEPEVPRCTKKFEVFNPCGSACPLTCDNYKNPPVCTRQCVPGCYCQEGYVRNNAGNCVRPCDCPQVPRCRNNEAYTECGSACFLTCRNFLNPPKICTLQCVVGCQCKEGYVRDEISGKCVLPCDCPATGHKCRLPNEEYSTCGTACPDTCDNYKKPRACTLQCVEGCFCKSGFVRNNKGLCVPPCDC